MKATFTAVLVTLAILWISEVRSERVNEIACKPTCAQRTNAYDRRRQDYDCRSCCLTMAPNIYTDGRCDYYWNLCYCDKRDDLYRYGNNYGSYGSSAYYGSGGRVAISWGVVLPGMVLCLFAKIVLM